MRRTSIALVRGWWRVALWACLLALFCDSEASVERPSLPPHVERRNDNVTNTTTTSTTPISWRKVNITDDLDFSYVIREGKYIDIILESNYSGWYGIGFGAKNMLSADIIVVHEIGEGRIGISDMWATGYQYPDQDTDSGGQYSLTNFENLTTTSFSKSAVKFTRLLDTGESTDAQIRLGLNDIIYAWGDDWVLKYHNRNRGLSSVFITNGSDVDIDIPSRIITIDRWNDYSVVFINVVAPIAVYIAKFSRRMDRWVDWHETLMRIVVVEVIITLRGAAHTVAAFDVNDYEYRFGWDATTTSAMYIAWFVMVAIVFITVRLFQRKNIAQEADKQKQPSTKESSTRSSSSKDKLSAIEKQSQSRKSSLRPLGKEGFIEEAAGLATFTMGEFQQKCADGAQWTMVSDNIFDLSKYIAAGRHPGGPGPLLAIIGKDATMVFGGLADPLIDVGGARVRKHSRLAHFTLAKMLIGRIKGSRDELNQRRLSSLPNHVESMMTAAIPANKETDSIQQAEVQATNSMEMD
ncbi:hypothetical protein HK102_006699 [Quaeritorhiza haematococci]|nr:hypothetical protein HK102_006699 [Quaeritorhiza haematococci]